MIGCEGQVETGTNGEVLAEVTVKKYRVEPWVEEPKALVSRDRGTAYKQTHARGLVLSDENQGKGPMMDQEIPGH